MAVGVQRPAPPPQAQYSGGSKGSSKWAKIGTAAGMIGGAVAGTFAAPGAGTAAGATAGAAIMGGVGGAATGSSLGGMIGGTADKKAKDPGLSYVSQGAQPVQQSSDPISRRLAQSQQDTLATLGEGLRAVGRAEPQIQQQYGPPIFESYMKEFDKRQQRGVV